MPTTGWTISAQNDEVHKGTLFTRTTQKGYPGFVVVGCFTVAASPLIFTFGAFAIMLLGVFGGLAICGVTALGLVLWFRKGAPDRHRPPNGYLWVCQDGLLCDDEPLPWVSIARVALVEHVDSTDGIVDSRRFSLQVISHQGGARDLAQRGDCWSRSLTDIQACIEARRLAWETEFWKSAYK